MVESASGRADHECCAGDRADRLIRAGRDRTWMDAVVTGGGREHTWAEEVVGVVVDNAEAWEVRQQHKAGSAARLEVRQEMRAR